MGADVTVDAVARVRGFTADRRDAPCVTAGRPLPGAEGFRRSHRLTHHARWLPTDLGSMASQLLIQEKLVDGSERILFSRGRLGQ